PLLVAKEAPPGDILVQEPEEWGRPARRERKGDEAGDGPVGEWLAAARPGANQREPQRDDANRQGLFAVPQRDQYLPEGRQEISVRRRREVHRVASAQLQELEGGQKLDRRDQRGNGRVGNQRGQRPIPGDAT